MMYTELTDAGRQTGRRLAHERVLDRVVMGAGCCWISDLGLSHGYSRVQVDGRSLAAHRVVYEALVGPIPDGLTIDHLCRVRNCVNPEHLEPVTLRMNLLRAPGYTANRTHCPRGHEYNDENTRHYRGRRNCRACRRVRYYEKGI